MSLNRTAKGIVLVPSLLLGGAFLAAAVWGDTASDSRPLALGLGAVLMGTGLLAQLLPERAPDSDEADPRPARRQR
ncbi:MAG: GIVxVP protein [Synechococcus sp. ELA057]